MQLKIVGLNHTTEKHETQHSIYELHTHMHQRI